jgi:methionine-rich copper-binding protein CopC
MTKTLKGLLSTALLVGGLAAATNPVSESEIHFALSTSAPEADAAVETVTEIRLSFTEAPAEGTTSIRLLDADEEPIHTMDIQEDPEDGRVFFVATHGALPAGSYSVAWRGMGADGHVVRETFAFTVTGQ